MRLRHLILSVLLLACMHCSAQRFHGLYANFEYQTNFKKSILNGTLDYEWRFTIDSMIHLASIGLGGGIHPDNTYLTDIKLLWALSQGWICHFFWFERYPQWYVAAHYRFSPDLSQQFICPETGYNIRLSPYLFVTPAVNYYWNLKCACRWQENFYPTIKLTVKCIQEPGAKAFFGRRHRKPVP